MNDLVVLNAPLNFVSCEVVVLFIELVLERIAELLNAILDELGVNAEC